MNAHKLVLDTNVALDWLVFADPRFAPIAARIAAGEAQVLTTPLCAAEFLRVLAYPTLKLSPVRQQDVALAYAASTRLCLPAPLPSGLPVCRDGDDQKFLELAAAVGAQWLITHDRALLALARRLPSAVRTRIAPPRQVVAAWAGAGWTLP
ncbi:MAG: putative toxin-antitoxin system toxin component, PIN family [Betaproteobacteria bacterium]|nr:putative toxin-antitoxin system toxin component, PIN family [Betaproteobacteria bacterium]